MKTREKIIINCKEPITIKNLKDKTGLKWANLSRHLSRLRQEGLIIEVGKDGKSKVIQLNKYKYKDHLASKQDEINFMKNVLK